MVLRPDSGDPVSVVIQVHSFLDSFPPLAHLFQALKAADKVAGHTVNKKGFKVINGFSVIQGDGISYTEIKRILEKVLSEGYSAQCVAFGMGGGLLQRVNRDTMSFATKLSFIRYADGREVKVMKKPATESGKKSFPGILKVIRDEDGHPVIYPSDGTPDPKNLLQVVYDNGPVKDLKWDDFDTIRDRVAREWVATPKDFDPISLELHEEVHKWVKHFEATWSERNKLH